MCFNKIKPCVEVDIFALFSVVLFGLKMAAASQFRGPTPTFNTSFKGENRIKFSKIFYPVFSLKRCVDWANLDTSRGTRVARSAS